MIILVDKSKKLLENIVVEKESMIRLKSEQM